MAYWEDLAGKNLVQYRVDMVVMAVDVVVLVVSVVPVDSVIQEDVMTKRIVAARL